VSIYRVDVDFDRYMTVDFDKKSTMNIIRSHRQGAAPASYFSGANGSLKQFNETATEALVPDISRWSHYLVFSVNAYQVLSSSLAKFGEFVEVTVDDTPWYVFVVTHIEDADDAQSEGNWVDGVLMGLEKLVFPTSASGIFKTDFDKKVRIFCDDSIKDNIDKSDMTGLVFSHDLIGF